MKPLEVATSEADDVREIFNFYGVPTSASDRIAAQLEKAVLHLCHFPDQVDAAPNRQIIMFSSGYRVCTLSSTASRMKP